MTEQEFREKYYPEARKQTLDTLPAFLDGMMKESFGYGTICIAVVTAALGAASAVDHSPSGGITGFQAGAIMWEFLRQWNYSSNKTGLKIVDYDHMLYPQYDENFAKTISKDTFEALQKEAAIKIQGDLDNEAKYKADVIEYQKALKVFVDKHDDYYIDPSKYDKIGMGTGDEWKAQEEKEKAGFEFAPTKPWYEKPHCVTHWQSIVNGRVPFGYVVNDDKAGL